MLGCKFRILGAFLEIEEIKCLEISNGACGPLLEEMCPIFIGLRRTGGHC
jgi:hypothetical protein